MLPLRGSSGGGFRNLPRHSSPRGWRVPVLPPFSYVRVLEPPLAVEASGRSLCARQAVHPVARSAGLPLSGSCGRHGTARASTPPAGAERFFFFRLAPCCCARPSGGFPCRHRWLEFSPPSARSIARHSLALSCWGLRPPPPAGGSSPPVPSAGLRALHGGVFHSHIALRALNFRKKTKKTKPTHHPLCKKIVS